MTPFRAFNSFYDDQSIDPLQARLQGGLGILSGTMPVDSVQGEIMRRNDPNTATKPVETTAQGVIEKAVDEYAKSQADRLANEVEDASNNWVNKYGYRILFAILAIVLIGVALLGIFLKTQGISAKVAVKSLVEG